MKSCPEYALAMTEEKSRLDGIMDQCVERIRTHGEVTDADLNVMVKN
jgi:hypothetical protein